jgi:hypothetical protein
MDICDINETQVPLDASSHEESHPVPENKDIDQDEQHFLKEDFLLSLL